MDTLATIYLVCGLPSNPQCWTLAQPDHSPTHLPGALPRFWRPEVLGNTVSGQEIRPHANHRSSYEAQQVSPPQTARHATHPPSQPRSIVGLDPTPHDAISMAELTIIQTKAIKLAFPREVEVIASNVQPSSTTHCFSFTVPSPSDGQTQELLSDPFGRPGDHATTHSISTRNRPRAEKTYYAACLQVWSHSDRTRAEAIRKTVDEGSKAKSAALARAIKAASAGRKLTSKLEQAATSPMGILSRFDSSQTGSWNASVDRRHSLASCSLGESTDTEDTEGFLSESEWEMCGEPSRQVIIHKANLDRQDISEQLSINTPFWLPYCLVLISKFPLYDLMVDHLKISWARYHHSIFKHSQEMLKMLNFSLPKSGSVIKVPVGSSKESHTNFIVQLPGKNDLSNGGLEQINFTIWPLFKCLSMSHIISIYEIGLSPMGRILFFSNYPAILNIAVQSFKLLLELRGWVGLCQSVIHVRDFNLYLEDPGPFILGANSQLRPLATDISPEIMIVDLDHDTIKCRKPHPNAFSKGQERIKIERKIFNCLGSMSGPKSVPVELHEAFPDGRFRPFSAVEIKNQPSEAERLLAPPEWNWDQAKTIIVLDNIMSKLPQRGLSKVFKRKVNRQAAVLDSSALHVQEIIRSHTVTFVNRRDMLETKIWKLNRRLTFLMSEAMQWKQHFDKFQQFTNMLSQESQDLKTRLENERREHLTLTGVVAEQKSRQTELENRLLETEKAWMAAQVELAKAQDIREELQRQKEFMVSEMKSIALDRDHESLMDEIVPKIESRIGSRPLSRSSVRICNNRSSLTTTNLKRLTSNTRYSYQESMLDSCRAPESHEESEMGHDPDLSMIRSPLAQSSFPEFESDVETISDEVSAGSEPPDEDQRKNLSRCAVIETMRSIQSRLECALRTAGQLDEDELKSYDVSSHFAKSTLSRMSTDSHDSKIVLLQRGRKKPINSIHAEDENPCLSASSSPLADSVPFESRSLSADDSNDEAQRPPSLSRPSNRPPGSSNVSLLLPGSSIFGERPKSSPSNSTNGYSVLHRPRSRTLDTVLDEESEEGAEEEEQEGVDDDIRSRGALSCDDGESFVSANDESITDDSRTVSTDSSHLRSLANLSNRPLQGVVSRVSLICLNQLDLDPTQSSEMSNDEFIASKSEQHNNMIAFPTTVTSIKSAIQTSPSLDAPAALDETKLLTSPDEDDDTVMQFNCASGISLKGPLTRSGYGSYLEDLQRSKCVQSRGSFVSNCSSVTIKNHNLNDYRNPSNASQHIRKSTFGLSQRYLDHSNLGDLVEDDQLDDSNRDAQVQDDVNHRVHQLVRKSGCGSIRSSRRLRPTSMTVESKLSL